MTMTNEQLAADIKRVMELDAKRTQGEWFWSARTLRSDIRDAEGDVEKTEDILWQDMCGISASKDNATFLESASLMAAIIRQLAEIVRVQHEAGTNVVKWVEPRDFAANDYIDAMRKALALSAPIVGSDS